MKRFTYLSIAGAAIATLLLAMMAASQPASAGWWGFWGISPYLYLAAMNRWVKTQVAIKATLIVTVLASLIGVWVLVDAVFLHPDAQSGLAFLFAPLWQWFLLLIATVPLHAFNRGAMRPSE